jgi:hypothetical protein
MAAAHADELRALRAGFDSTAAAKAEAVEAAAQSAAATHARDLAKVKADAEAAEAAATEAAAEAAGTAHAGALAALRAELQLNLAEAVQRERTAAEAALAAEQRRVRLLSASVFALVLHDRGAQCTASSLRERAVSSAVARTAVDRCKRWLAHALTWLHTLCCRCYTAPHLLSCYSHWHRRARSLPSVTSCAGPATRCRPTRAAT